MMLDIVVDAGRRAGDGVWRVIDRLVSSGRIVPCRGRCSQCSSVSSLSEPRSHSSLTHQSLDSLYSCSPQRLQRYTGRRMARMPMQRLRSIQCFNGIQGEADRKTDRQTADRHVTLTNPQTDTVTSARLDRHRLVEEHIGIHASKLTQSGCIGICIKCRP